MATVKDVFAGRLLKALFIVMASMLVMAIAFTMTPQAAYADDEALAAGTIESDELLAASDSGSQTLYRLFQPANGEHHYTLSAEERSICLTQWGWVDEDVAWTCPSASSTTVYRLFHPETGLHHYTTSQDEIDKCVNDWGWTYEGPAWYSDDAQRVPVYRLFHPETGLHHYTTNANERQICLTQWGWVDEDIAWYGVTAAANDATDPSELAIGDEAIMGASSTSVEQMVRRYNAVGKSYPSEVYAQYGAGSIEQFCQILAEEAAAEGVRAEVVFAQTMHETGWLQFGGDVQPNQCNFAGIGATGGGNPGNSFNDWGENSVRKGLRAQVQHLKAYASTDDLNNETVDPRFTYVTRGCAPTVKGLSGRWASSSAYGEALIGQIAALLNS